MGVFADVNRTIEALLKSELPADIAKQVSISFATPDDTFPPTNLTLPAINLFLFEINENTELRTVEPLLERRSDGSMMKIPPPVHVDCHYIVTAIAEKQTGSEQDEHDILGATLHALLRHRVLPSQLMKGTLAGKTPPIRATTARKGSTGIELWQALKGKPRACLHYTLTIPVDVAVAETTAGPVTSLQVGGT